MSKPSIVPATIEKIEVEFLLITLRVDPSNRESFLKDPRLFTRQAIEAGGLQVNGLYVADYQVEEARKVVQNSPVDQPVPLVKVTAHVISPKQIKSQIVEINYKSA
jgi:glutamate mutase epsilon subunit